MKSRETDSIFRDIADIKKVNDVLCDKCCIESLKGIFGAGRGE